MNIFHSIFAARVIFILGILNFLLMLFLLFTCRCLPTSRIGKGWMKNRNYVRVYKYHCYLWYVLAV